MMLEKPVKFGAVSLAGKLPSTLYFLTWSIIIAARLEKAATGDAIGECKGFSRVWVGRAPLIRSV